MAAHITGLRNNHDHDGFHAYLQHDPRKDFVVDLDDVFQWLGFTRKDNAKVVVNKILREGIHYRALLLQPQEQTTGRGGHNKECILLTIHGFKQLCMAANTDKARRVRDYYITMEEVLFEYTRRKMVESALLLEQRDVERKMAEAARQQAEAELRRYKERTFDPVPTDEIVYVNKEVAELSSDRHKVGITIDEKKRQSQLNTGSAQGSKMIFRVSTNNAKLVETIAAHVLRRYHCGREHYNCRVEHTIDVIRVAAAVCDTLASTYEHITTEELYERVTAAVAAILHESEDAREDSNADIELDAESESSSDSESEVSDNEPDTSNAINTSPEYLQRLDMVSAWLDRAVDFAPVRDPVRDRRKRFFAYLPAADMLTRMMADLNLGSKAKTKWKALLAQAMASRGRSCRLLRPVSDDTKKACKVIGYDRVCWRQ